MSIGVNLVRWDRAETGEQNPRRAAHDLLPFFGRRRLRRLGSSVRDQYDELLYLDTGTAIPTTPGITGVEDMSARLRTGSESGAAAEIANRCIRTIRRAYRCGALLAHQDGNGRTIRIR